MSKYFIDEKAAMEKWQQVPFSNRYMFRLVMENAHLCRRTLEIILGLKIKKLTYLEQEKSYEANLASKGIRLDIYIEDADGIAYDLEMQASDDDGLALGKRTRYYQSLIDVNILKKGQSYHNLKKSIIIFICKYDPFGYNLLRYTFSNLCKENKAIELKDESSKLFINTTGTIGSESKDLLNLIEYINYGTTNDSFTTELAEAVALQHRDKEKAVEFMTFDQYIMEAEYRGALKQKAISDQELAAERKKTEDERKKAEAERQKAEQVEDSLIQSIKNLMNHSNYSAEQAMKILGLSEELQAKYIKLL